MSLGFVSLLGWRLLSQYPENPTMTGPAKNRLHDYEAGWLTLLVSMRVATEAEVKEAWRRVAQKGIDDMDERKARQRKQRRRQKRPD